MPKDPKIPKPTCPTIDLVKQLTEQLSEPGLTADTRKCIADKARVALEEIREADKQLRIALNHWEAVADAREMSLYATQDRNAD